MALDRTARRRWLGGVVLLLAGGMLVCGETVLKSKLQGGVFLVYWLACLGFTGLAILIALQDLKEQRHQGLQQQRDLLDSALKEIQDQAQARARTTRRPEAPNGRKSGTKNFHS